MQTHKKAPLLDTHLLITELKEFFTKNLLQID